MPALEKQIRRLRSELESRPRGLVRHVQRVLEEALELAERWDADPVRVELAVWGHDLFRAEKPAALLRMAAEAGIHVDPVDEAEPVLLHGPIAAATLEHRFAINDADVLAAVRDHTLGLAQMPLIAKIILLADKVEANKRRRHPAMKQIRRLARRDLDTALLCWADWKWVQERTFAYNSHPQHWQARQEWVVQHHLDIGMPRRVDDAEFLLAAQAG